MVNVVSHLCIAAPLYLPPISLCYPLGGAEHSRIYLSGRPWPRRLQSACASSATGPTNPPAAVSDYTGLIVVADIISVTSATRPDAGLQCLRDVQPHLHPKQRHFAAALRRSAHRETPIINASAPPPPNRDHVPYTIKPSKRPTTRRVEHL